MGTDFVQLRRGYRQFGLTLAILGGVSGLLLLRACLSSLAVSYGVAALVTAFVGVVFVIRGGRSSYLESDAGIKFTGPIFRARFSPWTEVQYVGWFILPQVAFYGRDIYIPMVKTRKSPMPIFLPATRSGMAGRLGLTAGELDREVERAAALRGVDFRARVPDLSLYVYSVSAAGAVICLTILLVMGWDNYC